VNEDDMGRFQRIEQLIEREVLKLQTPHELGDSPEWNPQKANSAGKRNFKRSGKKHNPSNDRKRKFKRKQ
jgi:ATP-dependent RNA helicase RhlE